MHINDLIIIRAGVNNAEILTKLSITTFRDAFGQDNKPEDMDKYIADEMNLKQLTKELSNKENIFFLAWDNKMPVGYAKLRATNSPEELKNNNPIEIERLYVLKAYQNKKIGEAIMKYCIEYAINQKHDIIWLGVWEHNLSAIRFYKRYGFELFGAHSFVLGNDEQTDMLMKKVLK